MFRFFRKKRDLPEFVFKDSRGAFEYACKYMDCTFVAGRPLPAYVGDMTTTVPLATMLQTDDRGLQRALLTVVSSDGGFRVIASTPSKNGPRLSPGDLVAWVPSQHLEELGRVSFDQRFGWVGLIIATLKPQLSVDKGWAINERFLPD